MARTERAWGTGREFRFEARCTWCGPVTVEREGLHVFVSHGGAGLFEFLCPECGHPNFRSLSISDLEALAMAGVRPTGGRAPFELMEERSGPPISWDDLIDFHETLAKADNVGDVPRISGGSRYRALERNAA